MKYPVSNQSIYAIAQKFETPQLKFNCSPYWSNYLSAGSHLWMDSGDIDGVSHLWNSEFSALTTNNTLLNAEVQKGVYDAVFKELGDSLKALTKDEAVQEIAFCINAIHGLRLAKIFNCKVSVELHTAYADDVEQTFEVGKRLFSINKEHFIIKVPFTAAGILAARKLHDVGVPVNMTLGFSVRQNVIASLIAKPAYCNVFVGRIGAYFENNHLGSGINIGEKVTAETQKCMRKVNERGYARTRLIAASIREAGQLLKLRGADVLTIPVKVVAASQELKDTSEVDHLLNSSFEVERELVQQFNLKHLWQAREQEKNVAMRLANKPPHTVSDLIDVFNEYGCRDIFPKFSALEVEHLTKDGKIPVHNKWAAKIENYQVGIDTLLNKAGLLSFMKDQQQLDDKIRAAL